jgi:steroid Delta-isomerase
MSTNTIEKVVADYFAATRAMDLDAWLATFDKDAVSYEPTGELPLTGYVMKLLLNG